MELFVMAAAIARARQMVDDRDPEADRAVELADLFCRNSQRKVRKLFRDLWANDDARKNRVAAGVMTGQQLWLGKGAMDIGLTAEAFKTRSITGSRSQPEEPKPRVAAAGS
jgi:hypothetical protein